MNKKTLTFSLFVTTIIVLISSCTSYKNVPYIQNSDSISLANLHQLYDARIMPKDILTIAVTCPDDADAAKVFNLVIQANRYGQNNILETNITNQQYSQLQYIVSNEGEINFPKIGTINVQGLTKNELEDKITNLIYPKYLAAPPVVTVQMSNFKVSVLGEVARPGSYSSANGKMNVFEALAQAGDMTIYGRRDIVKVVREAPDGNITIESLNLNDANVVGSPYYQLQQNDVVYVTPNKTKSKNSGIGTETSLWFTSVSILISMASLLYNILR